MTLPRNHLELLSPARDADIGREAVLHWSLSGVVQAQGMLHITK